MLQHRKLILVSLALALGVVVGFIAFGGDTPARPPAEGPTASDPEIEEAAPDTDERVERIGGDEGTFRRRGRVVDAEGEPVSGVGLQFESLFKPKQFARTTSGPKGRFLITGIRLADEMRFYVTNPQEFRQLESPQETVTIPGEDEIIIRVERRPPPKQLNGRILDDAGQPIADATVHVVHGPAAQRQVSTDDEGGFEITSKGPFDGDLSLLVEAPGFLPARRESVLYDQEPIEIRLDRAHGIRVRVVELGTGRAVENFAVRVRPAAAKSDELDRPCAQGHHPNGEAQLTGLWQGPNLICAVPDDPALADSQVLEVDPTKDDLAVLHVQRLTPLRVHLRWKDGQPAANLRVQLVDSRSSRLPAYVFDMRERPLSASTRWLRHAPIVASRSTTDETGGATLGVPRKVRKLTVRVDFARPPLAEFEVRLGERRHYDHAIEGRIGSVIDIELPDIEPFDPKALGSVAQNARLSGRVQHSLGDKWKLYLKIAQRMVPLGENGEFDFQLEPGKHGVKLVGFLPIEGSKKRKRTGSLHLDWVTVRSGQHLEHDFECPRIGALYGSVRIGDEIPSGHVTVYDDAANVGRARVPIDDEGNYRIDDVWPERVLLRVDPGHGRAHSLWNPDLHTYVQQDRDTRVDLVFTERTVTFRVRHQDGRVAANERLAVGVGGVGQRLDTDEHGIGVVTFVPKSGTLTLFRTWKMSDVLAEVVLSPKKARYEQSVTLYPKNYRPETSPSDEPVPVEAHKADVDLPVLRSHLRRRR